VLPRWHDEASLRTSRHHGRGSEVAPAVAAVVAAGAAVFAAAISSNSSSADARRVLDRGTRPAHQEAVGAGRLLAMELATAEVYLEGMLRIDRMIPYDDKYDIDICRLTCGGLRLSPRSESIAGSGSRLPWAISTALGLT
jgi:hypothetical protein